MEIGDEEAFVRGDDEKVDTMKSIPNTTSNMSREVTSMLRNLSSIGKVKELFAKMIGKQVCSYSLGICEE